MTAALDLEIELASLEARRRELREARQQRIQDLQFRLASAQDRLRQLSQPPKLINPNDVAVVRAAHRRYADAVHLAGTFVDYHELPASQRIKGIDANGKPIANLDVFAAKRAEAERLNAACREAEGGYHEAYNVVLHKLQAEARAAEQRAAAEAARTREEIAGIEGELARLAH